MTSRLLWVIYSGSFFCCAPITLASGSYGASEGRLSGGVFIRSYDRMGSIACSRVADKRPFGMIPAPMAEERTYTSNNLSGCSWHGPAQGRPPDLPHQVVRDLEGGIRIVRIDLGAGLVHPNDERGIALGDLVGDNPGYQFGGAALADDHQATGY